MDKISKHILKQIYEQVDIDSVFAHYGVIITQRAYPEIRMRCLYPWHDDLRASSAFNVAAEPAGVYNCSVCGGGNFFHVIQKLEGLQTFEDSVYHVAEMVGYDIEGSEFNHFDRAKKLVERLEHSSTLENDEEEPLEEIELPDSFEPAWKYPEEVAKRKTLTEWEVENFSICYCADEDHTAYGRLIIPWFFDNKVVTYAGRDVTGRADKWTKIVEQAKEEEWDKVKLEEHRTEYECQKVKYAFHNGKSPIVRIFFNWDEAIKNKEYVILTEGAFDAMKLCEWGYNAVAIPGIQLNRRKQRMLVENFKTIYVALDNDSDKRKNWGQIAAQKIIEKLSENIDVHNILLPPKMDPDDCEQEEFRDFFEASKRTKLVPNWISS